jgi:hypothetical protein
MEISEIGDGVYVKCVSGIPGTDYCIQNLEYRYGQYGTSGKSSVCVSRSYVVRCDRRCSMLHVQWTGMRCATNRLRSVNQYL